MYFCIICDVSFLVSVLQRKLPEKFLEAKFTMHKYCTFCLQENKLPALSAVYSTALSVRLYNCRQSRRGEIRWVVSSQSDIYSLVCGRSEWPLCGGGAATPVGVPGLPWDGHCGPAIRVNKKDYLTYSYEFRL